MAIVASFTQKFNLALSTKQFQMTDTSTGLSATANLRGSFRITAPSGNPIYDNIVNYQSGTLADIIGATSLNNVTTIVLPPLENGIYTIYYQLWDSGSSTMASCTETFNVEYTSPIVDVQGTVQVYTPSPLITLTDNTVYQVGTIVPTISRVATISYQQMLINGVLTTPTPTVGTTAVTTSNTFYSPTTSTLTVQTNLTYSFTASGTNSAYQIIDYVYGEDTLPIEATTYCNTVCGLNEMACRVQANPQDNTLQNEFNLAMSYWTLIMANQNCGNMDKINGWLLQIQSLGSFDKNCTCCKDKFQQVIGLGGLVSAYNVISPNGYIIVTPTTSGGTTTFSVQLQQAFIDSVNAVIAAQANDAEDISNLETQLTYIYVGNKTIIESTDTSILVTTPSNVVTGGAVISGSGYTDGDIVSIVGGTHGGSASTFEVFVSTNGYMSLVPYGSSIYTVIPPNPVTLSGGSGSGTANVAWATTYNLKVNFPATVADGGSASSGQTITNSYVSITSTQKTITSTGTYLFWVEFILQANGSNTSQYLDYQFYVNSTPVGIGRVINLPDFSVTYNVPVFLTDKITAMSSDVISVYAKYSGGSPTVTILTNSVSYLKIT